MQNVRAAAEPCDVWGALSLSSEAGEISVTAEKDQVTVVLPQSFDTQFSEIIGSMSLHHGLLSMVHEAFETMDVKVAIIMSGREIAVIGRGSHPGLVSRTMAIDPIQVKLFPLFASWLDGKSARIRRRLHGDT